MSTSFLDETYQGLPPAWDHQVDDLPYLVRGSFALFWEQRLGKTRACGEALRILDAERKIDGAVILCPVNAKHVWGHNLDLFLPDWPVFVCDGLKPSPIPGECRAVLVNPAILIQRQGGFRGWHEAILDWIKLHRRKVVFIEDESDEYLINTQSNAWKAARSVARVAERVWLLSGTPMEKSGLDIHHQLVHLGPAYPFFLWSRDQFGKRFCEIAYNAWRGVQVTRQAKDGHFYKKPAGGNDYGLLRDPDGLWRGVAGAASRRLRRDCLDVPKTRRLDAWVDSVRQTGRPVMWAKFRKDISAIKVDRTVEYVRRLLEAREGPIVVGGWFTAFTEEVARKLQAPLVRGGVSADTRARIYNDFQAGKIPVIVGNIRAMSRSVELSRAHHVVMGELHWGARDNRQFEDRVAGINQTQEILIHYLLVRHSVDEEIWDQVLLKGKAMDDLDEAARRLREYEAQGMALAELEDVE